METRLQAKKKALQMTDSGCWLFNWLDNIAQKHQTCPFGY
jgi:hypothetical protein